MFRRHPAPRCRNRGLSPALAPASGSALRRVRQKAIGAEAVSSFAYPTFNRRLRGRTFQPVPRTVAPCPTRRLATTPPRAPTGRSGPRQNTIALPSPCPLRRAEAVGEGHSGNARTDPATPSWVGISLDLRRLAFNQEMGSAPFRCLESATEAAIRQADKPALIHCPPISLWRAVDKSSFRRKSRASNYRSRWASKRKRSALSLMNPSASFWS
jgi:hypothetical protein